MKKFSFGLVAAAALVSPAFADDTAPAAGGEKPPICPVFDPVFDAGAVCADAHCAHEAGHEVMMTTMVAIPEGEIATDTAVDPSLMSMTGGPVDDTAGPVRHEEGENFRDLSGMQTLSTTSTASASSTARFEGLTHSALERNGFGADRSHVGDRSSLKSMLFGSKKEASAKTTLVANERGRMQKMAEIDQLRDRALKAGDAKLLSKADAMEKELKTGAKASGKFSLFRRK